MPDVGLFTAGQPLTKDIKVVVKYSVEVGGLPVYQESYDVDTLAKELKKDEKRACAAWLLRLKAPVKCRSKRCFSARLTAMIHPDGKGE